MRRDSLLRALQGCSSTRSLPSLLHASTSLHSLTSSIPTRRPKGNRRFFSLIHTPFEESEPRIAKVPNRSLISIEGKDTIKFVQGLITNDIKSLSRNHSLYCAFLNPTGRMLSTAFIFSPREECVLVDIDAAGSASLMAFIKRFKLRSKVVLKDVSQEYQVWATWGKEAQVPRIDSSSSCIAWGRDERSPQMGYRFITEKDTKEESNSSSTTESYSIHRILQGVPDGANEIWEAQSLPLEANVDFMNGVDFRKGCYVGQELTARTHHTGVVRKRVIPIQFYDSNSKPSDVLQVDTDFTLTLPERGADIRSIPMEDEMARGKSTGKYLSGIHNIGLALLRLEQVHRWNSDLLIKVKANEDNDLFIRPWIPNWWPDEAKSAQ